MTKEEIIRMAGEAGFEQLGPDIEDWVCFTEELECFFQAAYAAGAAAEREACAKVCDDKHDTWRWDDEADSASGPRDCAAAIRARGNP